MADKNKDWVDFKEVKEQVTMQMVLDHYYHITLHPVGEELRGACPIHKGAGKQFSVNLKKNAFQCFYSGCKAKGNVLDFVALMEHCTVRDAALKLAEWFKKVGEPIAATGGKGQIEGVTEDVGIEPNQPINFYDFIITRYEGERQMLLQRLAFLDEGIAIAKAMQNTSKSS